jgi:hypothetical protein
MRLAQVVAEGGLDEGANVVEVKAGGRAGGHGPSAFAPRAFGQAEHASSVTRSGKNEGTSQPQNR